MRTGIIYIAINKINGKGYIGQTRSSLERRRKQHERDYRFMRGLHGAIKKYGKENFEWQVIFENIIQQSELDLAEDWAIWNYMTLVPSGYNLKNGGKTGGVSEHGRERLRIAGRSEKNLLKLNNCRNSEKHIALLKSPERRAMMSKYGKDRNWADKLHTKEIREKIRQKAMLPERRALSAKVAREKLSQPVKCVELEKVFNSYGEASAFAMISKASICRAATGKQEKAGGYTWVKC